LLGLQSLHLYVFGSSPWKHRHNPMHRSRQSSYEQLPDSHEASRFDADYFPAQLGFNTRQRLRMISYLKIMHKTRLHKGRLTANDSLVNVIFMINSAKFYI